MDDTNLLPRFRCHKEVRAFKIVTIRPEAGGGAFLGPAEGSDLSMHVDRAYMEKHQPEVGGYLVSYKDGYLSFSPADAFEEGYTKIRNYKRAGSTLNFMVQDPGHAYQVFTDEGALVHVVDFLKKEKNYDTNELVTVQAGLTNEIAIAILIDRMEYLQEKLPCDENEQVIRCLRDALTLLEQRTHARTERGVEGTNQA